MKFHESIATTPVVANICIALRHDAVNALGLETRSQSRSTVKVRSFLQYFSGLTHFRLQ